MNTASMSSLAATAIVAGLASNAPSLGASEVDVPPVTVTVYSDYV